MADERLSWATFLGRHWTEQNRVSAGSRVGTFRELLSGLEVNTILEIGCNRGYNLEAISRIDSYRLVGVDICRLPLESAKAWNVCQADINHLPFKDKSFDLVLTVAVLLYFTAEQMLDIVKEVSRVQRRYLLAIEYGLQGKVGGGKVDECYEGAVRYKPSPSRFWEAFTVWWGRDYSSIFPGLIGKGYLGHKAGFNSSHWWLFDKESA